MKLRSLCAFGFASLVLGSACTHDFDAFENSGGGGTGGGGSSGEAGADGSSSGDGGSSCTQTPQTCTSDVNRCKDGCDSAYNQCRNKPGCSGSCRGQCHSDQDNCYGNCKSKCVSCAGSCPTGPCNI
jgi:hypothetical protein